MSIINVVVIETTVLKIFELRVKKFLEHNEEMVFHEKTVYGITQYNYIDDEFGMMYRTKYSAIFQMEGEENG